MNHVPELEKSREYPNGCLESGLLISAVLELARRIERLEAEVASLRTFDNVLRDGLV